MRAMAQVCLDFVRGFKGVRSPPATKMNSRVRDFGAGEDLTQLKRKRIKESSATSLL